MDEILWLAPYWYKEDSSRDPKCEWAREPGALAEIRPIVGDEVKTAQFLASKGPVLSTESDEVFLDAVLDDLRAASQLLQRRAEGDYSADEHAGQFPKFEPQKPQGTTGKPAGSFSRPAALDGRTAIRTGPGTGKSESEIGRRPNFCKKIGLCGESWSVNNQGADSSTAE